MADLSNIRPQMEIVGADGARVGTVEKVEGNRLKMTKQDSGSHSNHHHYISGGLVATVEGNKVRLTANADAAVLLEEEQGGQPIMDNDSHKSSSSSNSGSSGSGSWTKVAIGAAALGAAAAAGAYVYNRRKDSGRDERGGETEVDVIFVPDETTTTRTEASTVTATNPQVNTPRP